GLWRGGARGEAARECHEVGAQGDEWDQPGQRGDAGVDRRGGDPLAQPSRATSRGFFFQAEDGIRDYKVTGVQTCALPIFTGNLRRSGLFAPIDPAAFIEKVASFDALPRFPDWKTINAQAIITGRVTRQGDGRLKVEFRLWDVTSGQQLTGQQYFTTPDNWRRIAHIVSDAVYERLTGEKGYFDTRVVFIDETGPKERRVKRLTIMDQDGANVRYLTRG